MKRWVSILLICLICMSLFAGSLYAIESIAPVSSLKSDIAWLVMGSGIASGTFVSIVRSSCKHA
ncbi:MAG: hypothetical protein IJ917_07435 [Firmicutes bacterium]|nr:hypothetical protein [Bacillota bacterium]